MESQTELQSMKFQELLTKIGRKIRAHDVEIFINKLKVTERLPPSLLDDIDIRGKNSGLEFLKKLQKEGYLAKDNLDFLKELLLDIERQDLLQELLKFEKKIKTSSDVEGAVARETEGYNIPPPILDMITPGRPPYRDPRRPPTPPSPLYPPPESQIVKINVEGGFHDLSSFGVLLQVPPNAVTHPTEMICRKIYPDLLLCATEENETLVSFCVEFESTSLVQLQNPIIVTLAHSGPSKKEGYETIVKELRDSWKKWKQIKEIQEDYPLAHEHLNSAYICLEIMIGERKALAVVTRLITDTFEVTDKGCVVRSSVCEDVTLEFPEGAVDESSMGSLKLLLMPDHIDILDGMAAYPCPIILIDGFEGVNFATPVKIKLPHPYPEGYPTGNVRLLTKDAAHEWKDITNEVPCVETESFIELQVSHFSWLWAWTYEIPLTVASSFSRARLHTTCVLYRKQENATR
ncbi:p53-induced death domain-containing protein 1-like isoform X2 [Actinia tenebrosa]|uniref:P53-induced death domain-containing protein 1-like isoform X2 n=1 Tax=Actinia tenebrosa TaxID=6105 RepID=A0A6P8J487_ACTTE|nr:p53-induced death domain-containing protein 1-like isoform X2 [Actinia tenebrosa]